jgi:hypothetical protein
VHAVEDRVSLLRAAAHDLAGASRRDNRWTSSRTRFTDAAGAPLDQVERDLSVTGQPASAEQVRQIDVDWVRQQPALRQSLGQPAPSPTAPPPPTG